MQRFFGTACISNICGALFFDGKYDKNLLEQALNEEIRLQDGMRIRFLDNNGETAQYVCDYAYQQFDFAVFDSEEELNAFGLEYAARPFELNNSQMYRAVIFELPGKSGILLCASHLISDAWTYSVIAREVLYIYNCIEQGKNVDLQERSYIDFIGSESEYTESERYADDKAYWTNAYRESPEPSQIKLTRKPVFNPEAKRYTSFLHAGLMDRTDEFCAENGISKAVVFEAAMILYLSKINSGNKSVTIGIPVLNRGTVSEKRTVGMYVSTVPLTVKIADDASVLSLCKRISDIHKAVFRHKRFPYTNILNNIHKGTDFTGKLYDVMVSCQNARTGIDGSENKTV